MAFLANAVHFPQNLTVYATRDTEVARHNTRDKKCAIINPIKKERGESFMKTRSAKFVFALMCSIVGIVQSVAALAAGGASLMGSYQPKVPEKLRR